VANLNRLERSVGRHGLIIILAILVMAAVTANVQPGLIDEIFAGVGLAYLGPGTAHLLMRVTDGLIVLLLVSLYVEHRPFSEIQRLVHRFENRVLSQLNDVRRELARDFNALHIDHVQTAAASQQLHELLEDRCGDSLGNLVDLVLPEGVNPMLRATIDIRLVDVSRGTGGDIYLHQYAGEFVIRQPDYVIGLVSSKGHLDRLRDANAPIDEIFVLADTDLVSDWSVREMVEKYDISMQYRDQRNNVLQDAAVGKVDSTEEIWRPRGEQDEFPLALLRLSFPTANRTREWAVRLTYQLPLSKREGFCFWTAARPMYVERITVNAAQLRGVHDFRFERFLPNFDRITTSDDVSGGVYTVSVQNWALKGHGVILTWQVDR
jgi:hypothetical protein